MHLHNQRNTITMLITLMLTRRKKRNKTILTTMIARRNNNLNNIRVIITLIIMKINLLITAENTMILPLDPLIMRRPYLRNRILVVGTTTMMIME